MGPTSTLLSTAAEFLREGPTAAAVCKLLVTTSLLIGLCGCGGGSSTPPPPTPNPSAVPFVDQSLIPAAIAPGGAGFNLTVNGTGFVSGSVVRWNGSALTTTFVSNSQLTANVSASDIASAGTASVTVLSPHPGGGVSNEVFFPIAPGAPVAMSGSLFATGSGPMSVRVGDFNGDGKLDLVVGNTLSGDISILLGNGDGTFLPAVDYPIRAASNQQGSMEIAVADFNGDGKLDLAAADNNTNGLYVFLGNGDGTFKPAVNYAVGTNPTSVAVADFNGDGKLDIAVSTQNCTNHPCPTANISILLGNGDGTFKTHVDYPAGVTANYVTVGDFNRDGKLDLAVANGQGDCPGCSSGISILLGKGDGTFQAPATSIFGTNQASIATADFNGDGKLDLVVVDNYAPIWILLGNGDGKFQAPIFNCTHPWSWGSIGIADFNGDGTLDLAIANFNNNDVNSDDLQILLGGNADHTFGCFSALVFSTGSQPRGVAVGDFNQNGRLDVALPNYNDNTVSVLLQ